MVFLNPLFYISWILFLFYHHILAKTKGGHRNVNVFIINEEETEVTILTIKYNMTSNYSYY